MNRVSVLVELRGESGAFTCCATALWCSGKSRHAGPLDTTLRHVYIPYTYPIYTIDPRHKMVLLWWLKPLRFGIEAQRQIAGTQYPVGSQKKNEDASCESQSALQERRKRAGITGAAQPNMVCSSAVHVCWEKLFNYFDIEPRYINLTEDCFVAKPEEVRPSCCTCGLPNHPNTLCAQLFMSIGYLSTIPILLHVF